MSAKDRLQQALAKDREERERRQAEGPQPFPVVGQLDSDGVEDVERPFTADVPVRTTWKVRPRFTGPVLQ